MKKKYGIIAVGIIALLVSLSFSPATATDVAKEKTSEIEMKYSFFSEDGSIFTEKLKISEEDLEELKEKLSEIMEQIKNKYDFSKIEKMVNRIKLLIKYPKLREFTLKMIKLMPRKSMAFVMSYGSCYKLNPFRKTEIKIKNRFTFWRYSGTTTVEPKTYILRPFRKDFDVLKGTQMGFMSKFTGLYIYVAKNMPKMSNTFFFGTARFVQGIDLTIPQLS